VTCWMLNCCYLLSCVALAVSQLCWCRFHRAMGLRSPHSLQPSSVPGPGSEEAVEVTLFEFVPISQSGHQKDATFCTAYLCSGSDRQ